MITKQSNVEVTDTVLRLPADFPEVPDDVKRTFERLGIPEQERKFLAGVEAQFDSEAAYSNIKEAVGKHDENITFDRACQLVGGGVMEQLRAMTLSIYNAAHAYAHSHARAQQHQQHQQQQQPQWLCLMQLLQLFHSYLN